MLKNKKWFKKPSKCNMSDFVMYYLTGTLRIKSELGVSE